MREGPGETRSPGFESLFDGALASPDLASLPCPVECGQHQGAAGQSAQAPAWKCVWHTGRFQRPHAFSPRGAGERRWVLAGSRSSTGWWRLLTPSASHPLPLLTPPPSHPPPSHPSPFSPLPLLTPPPSHSSPFSPLLLPHLLLRVRGRGCVQRGPGCPCQRGWEDSG